jgi:hypothetical protein
MNGTPPALPQKKKHGCLFYGCLTVLILALVGGLTVFFGARYVIKSLVNNYTEASPLALPPVNLTQAQQDALKSKIDAFKAALDGKVSAPPLVLSSDEINALIAWEPALKGRAHVAIEDNQVKATVSIPLDKLALPGVKGRYLNGTATLNVVLVNGQLFVTAQSVEVKGNPLPEQFMAGLRSKNLAADVTRNPDTAAAIAKIESLEIKDGQVIITPKPPPERLEDARRHLA